MVYICESCQFVFERKGEITDCPVCAAANLRPANEQEQSSFAQQEQK